MRLVHAALVVLAVVMLAGGARAHAIGVSRGTYRASPGRVDAELAFARGDVAALVGSIDALDAARPAMQAAIVDAIHVRAGGAACSGRLVGASLVEGDGVVLRVMYTCAPGRDVTIAFDLLPDLPHGHRHLAHVEGARAIDAVLFRAEPTLTFALDASPAREGSGLAFVRMGLEHILSGYDHLVFLLGLALVGGRVRSLALAVTAFTLAHSITLAVAVLGAWVPSPRIVEPAIALSIAYVGVESFFARDPSRQWRVTFPFGLVHGFGFAGALREIALPQAEVPAALLGFNAGVELGQIGVLLLALPVLGALRRSARLGDRAVKCLRVGVVMAGVGWFVARVALPA